MTAVLIMLEYVLHFAALGALARISVLIHSGNLLEAIETSAVICGCILAIAWTVAKARSLIGN